MRTFERNSTCLVTGGCGSIGSEIVKQLVAYGNFKQIRVLDNRESALADMAVKIGNPVIRYTVGDIRDADRVDLAMEGVDYVFHAAALKHVPLCEYNPFEAVKTNVYGTNNVMESASSHNVKKVVNISTDKAVNPINVLGATKLLAEKIVATAKYRKSDTIFANVRFGNVTWSEGSVFRILFGGSYFVERLTLDMRDGAYGYFDTIDRLGGMGEAIEQGYPQREIADSAFRFHQAVESRDKIIVGVNEHVVENETPIPRLYIDESVADRQLARLEELRRTRDNDRVARALDALKEAARGRDNTMFPILECARAYATVGEMCDALREVWGEYEEVPDI